MRILLLVLVAACALLLCGCAAQVIDLRPGEALPSAELSTAAHELNSGALDKAVRAAKPGVAR